MGGEPEWTQELYKVQHQQEAKLERDIASLKQLVVEKEQVIVAYENKSGDAADMRVKVTQQSNDTTNLNIFLSPNSILTESQRGNGRS